MQGLGVLEARRWAELGHGIGELLETMPKPTVAAVNGYALGGGCEVALACDIRLASTRARLGQPEVNLGIFPGWGVSASARTTSLGFAKELILTGRMVEADEALARGLVNVVVEPEELMPRAPSSVAASRPRVPSRWRTPRKPRTSHFRETIGRTSPPRPGSSRSSSARRIRRRGWPPSPRSASPSFAAAERAGRGRSRPARPGGRLVGRRERRWYPFRSGVPYGG